MKRGDQVRWLAAFAAFVFGGMALIWLGKQWWFWPESFVLAAVIVSVIACIYIRNQLSNRPRRY